MVRQETSLTNTAEGSQGTCSTKVLVTVFFFDIFRGTSSTWRSLLVSLAAIACLKLVTSISFFRIIPVTMPKFSKNFLTMIALSQLMGRFCDLMRIWWSLGKVVEAHVDVDQAALHLRHDVVNALGDVLVVEEEQATCPLVIDEVEVDALDAQAGDA